ncbi:MAG TPA: hypothetical protein VFZ25_09190 [Chloroflexota bacterium]|nr:hypothetical protein [Chloroflexota bacterium]
MDYGRLIGDAWTMTWRYRFLWVLALFAPAGVGGCGFNFPGNFNLPSSTGPRGNPTTPSPFGRSGPNARDFERVGTAIGTWIGEHLALILALAAVAVILFLAFLFLYFVAQGALATATIRLARGEPAAIRPAWQAGLSYFWRYVGLWLLQILIFLAAAIVVGILVGIGTVLLRQVGGGTAVALGVILGLLGFLLALAAIVAVILFSIVITYAQRIIVNNNVGPGAALNRGVALTRARLGTSALLWLINFGLGIGIGIATALVDFVILIPLAIVGAIFFIAFRTSPITFIYAGLALLVFIVGAWVVSAIGNTFMWNYWTLGYLKLEE